MASSSQGTSVSFGGGALSEVTSVTATSTSEAANTAANDNRLDVSHLGLNVGDDRLYLAAPLKDVPLATWLADNGGGTTTTAQAGDISVEMYGAPPAAGETGSLSVSGGGLSASFDCVQVTSSGITLAVGEAAKSSVTFTVVDPSACD